MTELITIKQLPIIEERLMAAKQFVDDAVSEALAMVCTEETILSVKEKRAELNKMFSELESQRRSVKRAVMDPYICFETVYRTCVSDAFKIADATLKQKINDVEDEMKRRCEMLLRGYYAELCEAHHIDFAQFERTGVSVSLSDAKAKVQPPKKLKDQLTAFVLNLETGMNAIATMDNSEEVMVEFKKCLSAHEAIAAVNYRHKMIEAERAAWAEREAAKAKEAEAVKKVEAFAPPEEVEPSFRVTFTVTITKSQAKRLKEFMNMEGIKYE